MFSNEPWVKDVYDIGVDHLEQFESWEVHKQPEREVPKSYKLNSVERAFLANVPDVSELRLGPLMPIACIHRIHKDGAALCGAQNVQESIGMKS